MAGVPPRLVSAIDSFVIRIWREEPGKLRGTIRHAQTKVQGQFTRLIQAEEFIEQHLTAPLANPAQRSPLKPSFDLTLFQRRSFRLASVAVLILIFAVVVILVAGETPNTSLLGNAAGERVPIDVLLAFLAGLAIGMLGSMVWVRKSKPA